MPKGINDDNRHYDQTHEIEDAIHMLPRKYASVRPKPSAASRAPT
jgi:hypothetical protein